jgi:hypothetical protein
MLSARSEGTTTVVLSAVARGGAMARADFLRVQVVSPEAAFAFRLGAAGNKRGELVVAPGKPAVVVISVAPAVALGGAADGALDCAASLLPPGGAEAKLPAALERAAAASSAELFCRFSVPSELQTPAAVRLQLLVGGSPVAQATFELTLGFALSSSDLRIGASGSAQWTLGGAGSRGTVEVIGAAEAVTAVSSDTSLISIAHQHELATAETTRRFTIERITNHSCGGAPVHVVFQNVATQQSVVLRVELPCDEGAVVALDGRRAGFLDNINLGATLLLTLALLVVAAIWLCSAPVAEPPQATQHRYPNRPVPGTPVPHTGRDNDLGSPGHWRH